MKQMLKSLSYGIVCLGLWIGVAADARADEISEIYRLADQKKLKQAEKRLTRFLEQYPRHTRARFLKGLIFTEQRRNREAIAVFKQLSEEFPELPEPFNNLAVLYAEEGKYDQARIALRRAIQTHPSYATAHENLGDIYAKLAAVAYNQALEIDKKNPITVKKLALVKKLFSSNPKYDGRQPVHLAKNRAQQQAILKAQSVREARRRQEERDKKLRQQQAEKRRLQLAAEKRQQALAVQHALALKKQQQAALTKKQRQDKEETLRLQLLKEESQRRRQQEQEYLIAIRDDILATVEGWRNAWSTQDVGRYLLSYGEGFNPPRGLSRYNWEKKRRWIIRRPKSIRITLKQIKIAYLREDLIQVRFLQEYNSDRYSDRVNKILHLQKEGSEWKIVQEQSQ
ncbi:L,D-transpeptidase Cds6 family protein [Magnetococcales bacterium HHB-1]